MRALTQNIMCLQLTDHRSELFANSIFQAIDKDRNEHITCDEYVSFMFNLECQDLKGRLKVMFEIFDVNNSGGLSLDQLSEILKVLVGLQLV